MTSEFYLVNKSFKYQQGISKDLLEEKIKDLSTDIEYIRKYKSETILVHDSIYEEEIYPNITVSEFLGFSPDTRKQFNKQVISYLINIIRKSKRTSFDYDDVVEVLLNEQSEVTLHGLICLNKIDEIDDKYLIYNSHNWLDFHRYFLGLFSQTPTVFIQECFKYFPELHFHENNIITVRQILNESRKTIIHHLTELNNNFPICRTQLNNPIELLAKFNSISRFEIPASREGDISKKKVLTFIFSSDNGGNDENVYCELHLKLLYDDLKTKKQDRIYFHEGKENIGNGKILVGYIGVHI